MRISSLMEYSMCHLNIFAFGAICGDKTKPINFLMSHNVISWAPRVTPSVPLLKIKRHSFVENIKKLNGRGLQINRYLDPFKTYKTRNGNGIPGLNNDDRLLTGFHPVEQFILTGGNENKTEGVGGIAIGYLEGLKEVSDDCSLFKWKSYRDLNYQGFGHLTVNHSVNFVDSDSGAHTNNIERIWRDVRSTIPRYGTRKVHSGGYLAEFCSKRRLPNHTKRLHHFFNKISLSFPLPTT
ncbi:hypothetical protein RF11_04868 [Thelohanellus kitauei]|uniref:ISXO2-like transposase domain-containing protein n=1 Tax=Thelohanellus kitauei TaxID=669202 RepID=A0A0C2MNB3_THEKT|nr:hypothetical protein RF11_04868 [Thelohanellus kitauei]